MPVCRPAVLGWQHQRQGIAITQRQQVGQDQNTPLTLPRPSPSASTPTKPPPSPQHPMASPHPSHSQPYPNPFRTTFKPPLPGADAAPTPASDTCPYGWWDSLPPPQACPLRRSRRPYRTHHDPPTAALRDSEVTNA